MFKFIVLACVFAVAAAGDLLYSPTYYSAYPAVAAAPLAAAPLAAAPIAYTRYAAPLTYAKVDSGASHASYSSVATPNSYQQQYRHDYRPLTYSTGYIY